RAAPHSDAEPTAQVGKATIDSSARSARHVVAHRAGAQDEHSRAAIEDAATVGAGCVKRNRVLDKNHDTIVSDPAPIERRAVSVYDASTHGEVAVVGNAAARRIRPLAIADDEADDLNRDASVLEIDLQHPVQSTAVDDRT